MILIIVESPKKAKAINEYLKNEKKYIVLSSQGHIRNLIKKNNAIDKEFNFQWDYTPQWSKVSKDILEYAKKAEKIILASDPDREGEAIAWHIKQVLMEHKIKANFTRIVFNAISKESILKALSNETDLRYGLVNAYLARTGLDYMFGFGISPVLWRKVSCCKSAGRVQSTALRLIVERENEIINFDKNKYITIHAQFKNIEMHALMLELNQEKFDQGQIFNKDIDISKFDFKYKIINIERKKTSIAAYAPFTTSTLQQTAFAKLNFNPTYTMQLAQKLYEGFKINDKHQGLITYMRTDSVNIVDEEIAKIRKAIVKNFDQEYLSDKKITHINKVKNAQEAHEAIRPLDIDLLPQNLSADEDLIKLYTLIWQRTLASQASNAINEILTIKIDAKDKDNSAIFEIKNTVNVFPGFKKILNEEIENEFDNSTPLKIDQELDLKELYTKDHETQPPKRYNEASIIKQLEKQGIGRPSTYNRITKILFEREYVENFKKTIKPTTLGWLVIAFLKNFFKDEVEYNFTTNLEDNLDDISNDKGDYLELLKNFSSNLDVKIQNAMQQDIKNINIAIESIFEKFFNKDNKVCPLCANQLVLKTTKIGCIRGCSNYPNCNYIFKFDSNDSSEVSGNNNQILGVVDQETIELKIGPYGPYVQNSIKKISIPKEYHNQIDKIDLEKALFLLSLPKTLGILNDLPIILKTGKFGPYIEYNKKFHSIKSIFDIDFEKAKNIISK